MNPQPRPDNITVAAITIITTSRWVLTSRSHSNTQTSTELRLQSMVQGPSSEVRPGEWRSSGRVFCRGVCAAQCSSSDSPLSSPGCSYIYPFWVGNATILDCWVMSWIPQSYVHHTGFLAFILDPSDYVAMADDAIPWVGPTYCPPSWMTHPPGRCNGPGSG